MKKEYDFKSMKRRPTKIREGESKVAITIRLDGALLDDIKNEALRMGLPYQSFINSILHRFVTGELIDKASKKTNL